MAKGKQILKEAHRPDPNWPLEGRSAAHREAAKQAWQITRERVKQKWAPENAVEF